MRDEWELDELISCWTLDEADWRLLSNKTGAPRLGFALLLKFFDLEGRFPADRSELPAAAVDYVASLVKVPAAGLDRMRGGGGRSNTTGRRSARSAGSGKRPARMNGGWPRGSLASCAPSSYR